MIRVFLGNLGSGKSACAVKEIADDTSNLKTYTNLVLKGVRNTVFIKPSDIIEVISQKGRKKDIYKLNIGYWEKQKKPLNVLWDEVHLTASSRRSSSKPNVILSQFMAMARRITGFDKRGYGFFTFIAQKERTIDVNIRELANEIVYHVSYWKITCEDCGRYIYWNSEKQHLRKCLNCGSWKILKSDIHVLRIFFNDWEKYYNWVEHAPGRWHFKREWIFDIEHYFHNYDTMQISNIWDSYILR